MRTFMEQPQKRPLDANFDIRSYRSQVKDRLHMSITTEGNGSKFNSVKKEINNNGGVPSFDHLQTRIRDFSQSRLGSLGNSMTGNMTPQKSIYSPYKAQGMQHKISETLGLKMQNQVETKQSYQTQFSYGQSPPQQYQKSQSYYQSPYQKPYTTQPNSIQLSTKVIPRRQGKTLADVVQLNEIVVLRNKIESSNVNRSSLTSTYVSELVKLAQAITTSLKQE